MSLKVLQVKSSISPDAYRLESIRYIESNNKFAHGYRWSDLSSIPRKNKARLNLDLKTKIANLSRIVKKQANLDSIPVLLKGKGFDFKPDYGYTTKKLISSMAKEQGERSDEKIERQIVKREKQKQDKRIVEGISLKDNFENSNDQPCRLITCLRRRTLIILRIFFCARPIRISSLSILFVITS